MERKIKGIWILWIFLSIWPKKDRLSFFEGGLAYEYSYPNGKIINITWWLIILNNVQAELVLSPSFNMGETEHFLLIICKYYLLN